MSRTRGGPGGSIGSEENMPINFSRGYESIGRRLATRSRRLGRMFARYRNARRSMRVSISRRSQRGLDWMNFFLADVQTGFGAFVAFYLADLGWPKDQVGLALTAGTLAGVLSQAPGGALVDAIRWKRGLVAIGIGMICVSALIFALVPSFPLVFAAELLHGLAGGIVTPAIAAISLGLVGRRAMSSSNWEELSVRRIWQRIDGRPDGIGRPVSCQECDLPWLGRAVHPRIDCPVHDSLGRD